MTKQPEQTWFALEISVDAAAAEAVEFALNELGTLGTEINHLGKDKRADVLLVAGYFNEEIADELVQTELNEALRIYGFATGALRETAWRAVENKDWLAEWKKNWQPTTVGNFVVAPTWSEVEDDEKIVIRIDPAMAFGTGTHETTRLCLRAIEESYAGAMSFLDVGTGTGILAIAAAKLAAEKFITACDTDVDSIEIARQNASLNAVADQIEFYVGSINADTPAADFVCANLTADVIVPLLPLLLKKSSSKLILSGILREQQDSVESELKRLGATDWKIETLGEWISAIIER